MIADQWESMKRPELAEFVKTKFAEMETIYTESTEEGSTTKSLTKDQGDEFKSRNEELTAATERLQALNAVDEGLKKARDANKSLFETNRTLPFPNGGQGGGEGEGEALLTCPERRRLRCWSSFGLSAELYRTGLR